MVAKDKTKITWGRGHITVFGIHGNLLTKLGTGKTLTAVWLALLFKKKYGLNIASNVHLYGVDYDFLEHPRQLIGLEKSTIILDDIYRYLGGRDSSIKRLCNIVAGESRKAQLQVIYTSSVLTDVVKKTLRRHTDYFIMPSHYKKTDLLNLSAYDPVGNPARVVPPYLSPVVVRKLYDFYDTNERVRIITDF